MSEALNIEYSNMALIKPGIHGYDVKTSRNGVQNLLVIPQEEWLEIINKHFRPYQDPVESLNIDEIDGEIVTDWGATSITVTNIGEGAFAECTSLKTLEVDPGNQKYEIIEDCLVDTVNGIVIQGLPGGRIPLDGSINKLGVYCFAKTNIVSIEIPERISLVPENAFSYCNSLISVKLPDSLRILDATCFAWCTKLAQIELPNNLTEIRTYVFHSCAFENVRIPASVEKVLSKSFGTIKNLRTVTFEERRDSAGNIIIPSIHHQAFLDSGSINSPITFEFPWTLAEHKAKFEGVYTDTNNVVRDKSLVFGAVGNCLLKFADGEEVYVENV